MEEKVIAFFMETDLLKKEMRCSKCDLTLQLKKALTLANKIAWRYYTKMLLYLKNQYVISLFMKEQR